MLGLVLCYSCKSGAAVRGQCCRRLGEGSRALFVRICVLSYESVTTSKYKAQTSRPLSQKILLIRWRGNLAISAFKSILNASVGQRWWRPPGVMKKPSLYCHTCGVQHAVRRERARD